MLPFGPMAESKVSRPEPYAGTANDHMYDVDAGVLYTRPNEKTGGGAIVKGDKEVA